MDGQGFGLEHLGVKSPLAGSIATRVSSDTP